MRKLTTFPHACFLRLYVLDADKNVIHLRLTIRRLQVLVGFEIYRRPFVVVLHLPLVGKVAVLQYATVLELTSTEQIESTDIQLSPTTTTRHCRVRLDTIGA